MLIRPARACLSGLSAASGVVAASAAAMKAAMTDARPRPRAQHTADARDRSGQSERHQLPARPERHARGVGRVRREASGPSLPVIKTRIRMTAPAARKVLHRACQTGETLLFTL